MPVASLLLMRRQWLGMSEDLSSTKSHPTSWLALARRRRGHRINLQRCCPPHIELLATADEGLPVHRSAREHAAHLRVDTAKHNPGGD